ncbi:MAG: two-component system, LytTR family, response regulator [Acidobacteriota bacterium]|jgi:two-component system LytT family response regulator|nr:two-component system, LytTR family, response regulator [Acidobacteriota bacterium]
MEKIRTLIVDDEPLAREGVRMLVEDDSEIEVVGECANGHQAIQAIEEEKPDLVFLDVQMPEINGFEVLEAVSDERLPTVIFVTAYDKYALRAFEVHALDYLLKPFTRERFTQALERAKAQIRRRGDAELNQALMSLLKDLRQEKNYLERMVIKTAGRIFFLSVEEIDWIEAAENYVRLHAGRESHLVHGTMNKLASRLDPAQFLRIHRSSIVNLKKIKNLQPLFHGEYVVTLHDGTQLSSGRSYRQQLQSLLDDSF